MISRERIERVISAILTLSTAAIAVLLLEQRLRPSHPTAFAPQPRLVYVDDWEQKLEHSGEHLSDSVRTVIVAVFTDFECPFCGRMDSVLTALENRSEGRVGRVIVHFPLPTHAHAEAAARAFHCASAQGHGTTMHASLFREQKMLGTVKWSKLAADAGVRDVRLFNACFSSSASSSAIHAGLELGKELKISGTPAVMVNGWLFDPSYPAQVEEAVQAILQGRKPTLGMRSS